VNEDTPLPITLTALDVDGDALTYTILISPAHGTLSSTPPNLTYLGNTNYYGPDSFSFKVNDGHVDSAVATVGLTVNPVNDPPVASVEVSPLLHISDPDTNRYILSPNNTNAAVVLDGSASWDVENDPLTFAWFESGATNAFATGSRTTNVLAVGEHTITLVVSDGQDEGAISVTFEIIRPSRAVAQIYALLEDSDIAPRHHQPLFATLNASMAAFEHGHFRAGANALEAFIQKVHAQVAPVAPALAAELTRLASQILATLRNPQPGPPTAATVPRALRELLQ